jgi:aminotransferase EvaB
VEIKWSYLSQKFPPSVRAEIFAKLDDVVARGDFTLGREVKEFEDAFAAKIGVKHAIGVGNGTDALEFSLLSLGIKPGDEVIVPASTFIATAGAVCNIGATPVFVDVDDNLTIDASLIEAAITPKTKVIMPVVWSGRMPDMDAINDIAIRNGLFVVEDSAQGIMSEYKGRKAGTFGHLAAFSLHPLKNVSVFGDGGVITTNNDDYAEWLRLYRNHGLIGRNTIEFTARNSRLDTVQAVVAKYVLDQVDFITDQRIKNTDFYDIELYKIPQITLSQRFSDRKNTYPQYENFYERRDELQAFLKENGVESLVHYPMPCYLNKPFGHKLGDFPVSDRHALTKLSINVHEHLTQDELQYTVDKIKEFYALA